MEILVLIIVLIMLDVVASRWGVNTSDGIDSPEWERRQRWYGFH